MSKAKASKLPSVRVASDDLVLMVGEQEYRPHAGEWVEFRAGLTVGDFIASIRLQHLQGIVGLSPEEVQELEPLQQQVRLK